MSEENLWSVFGNEHKVESDWIKELVFFWGDVSDIDFSNDWRFKAVEGKKKQLMFLGFYDGEFPIEFPITLLNGKTINSNTDF